MNIDYKEWLKAQRYEYDKWYKLIKSYEDVGIISHFCPLWKLIIEIEQEIEKVLKILCDATKEEIIYLNKLIKDFECLTYCKNSKRVINNKIENIKSLEEQIEFIITNFNNMHSKKVAYLSKLFRESIEKTGTYIQIKDLLNFPEEIRDFAKNFMFDTIYHNTKEMEEKVSDKKCCKVCECCGAEY